MNSELATEWHPTKNLPLRPEQVGQGAHKSVWWACSNYPNHEWRAAISARLGGTKCPFCANQSVLAGFNDLATRSPEIAKDWHPTKNGDVDPSQVAPSANRKFWWVCVNDSSHQWMATPGSRLRGSNCPKCANSGYDSSRNGLFYFIENRNLGAYKVGITNPGRGPSRVAAWQKAGWLVLATYESEDGLLIVNLETNLLRWIRKELGFAPYLTESDMKPLGGWSETFSVESMSSQEFLDKLELEIKDLEKQ
jgi:hypothetical protein